MNTEREAIGVGIVVLSASLKILHMNQKAMHILAPLAGGATSHNTTPRLITPLHEECQRILSALQDRLQSNSHELVHRDSTIGPSAKSFVVRGFGLVDPRGLQHSRIVFVLTQIPSSARDVFRVQGAGDLVSETGPEPLRVRGRVLSSHPSSNPTIFLHGVHSTYGTQRTWGRSVCTPPPTCTYLT